MRILVVGAGALGGLIGAHLSEAGEDVTLVEINQARARLLNETGIFVTQDGKDERCVKLQVISSFEGSPPSTWSSSRSRPTRRRRRSARRCRSSARRP